MFQKYGHSLLPVPVIDAESSSGIAKFYCSFRTSELAASTLKASFRIVDDLFFFKSKSSCGTESQAWFISAIFTDASRHFDVLLFVYFKAYKPETGLNTDVHKALAPLIKSERI